MRVLITGGNGYIGENLRNLYTKTNFEVSDYGPTEGMTLPLAHKLDYEDILTFDAIVHLAALSGLKACEDNPTKAVQENILTAMNVFNIATKAKIPVVFTSSQAAKEPTSSKYAFMKWSCEQIAKLYNNIGGKNYILRLANVYGGHKYLEKKQTCIKQFITRYRNGQTLIIHGDGSQTRDFIHVFDVCDAIMSCIAYTPSDKEPIDIGTGKATSIMQLQKIFPMRGSRELSKVRGFVVEKNQHYEFQEIRNVGADSSIADTSRAKMLLYFVAKMKLEDYIKNSVKEI